MKSPLSTLIMQIISERPQSSGYALTKIMEDSRAWTASHQQIYRECGQLQGDGLLDYVVEPQDGKPDRKAYFLTPKGSDLLHEAQTTPKKTVKLPKQHCESTVMLRLGNTEYFEQLCERLEVEVEQNRRELDRCGCQAEKLLIERSITLLAAEFDFAQSALLMLTEGQAA